MHIYENTLAMLAELGKAHESCLVSFSGGRDSWTVLDLALRSFKRVEAFFMWILPDLPYEQRAMGEAERRTGVKIRQYPHWALCSHLKVGPFSLNSYQLDDLPTLRNADIVAVARQEADCRLVLTGCKRCDSITRRYFIDSGRDLNLRHPLAEWSRYDVAGYLQMRGLPEPEPHGKMGGIDFSTKGLLWLHDREPETFELMERVFVFIRAVVKRREFYGRR